MGCPLCMGVLKRLFQLDGGAAVLGAAFLGAVVGNGLVGAAAHAVDVLGGSTQLHHVGLQGLGALLAILHVDFQRTGVVGVAVDGHRQVLVGLHGLADGVDGVVGDGVELGVGAGGLEVDGGIDGQIGRASCRERV